ncbi:MAG: hypothetical protein ACLGIS_11455, partial [Actinomycetes bacterium]
ESPRWLALRSGAKVKSADAPVPARDSLASRRYVLPFLLAWPEMPWVAVVMLVVALWSLCFTRTSITGLPARTGGLGAQPTASGSLPVNTVTGAEDQRSRSGS